jgi:hypothetical protein
MKSYLKGVLSSAFGKKVEDPKPEQPQKLDETCFFECADDSLILASASATSPKNIMPNENGNMISSL